MTPPKAVTRTTTDETLTSHLRQSLIAKGICPEMPTLREYLATLYAHGVTMDDVIESIEYTDRGGRLFVQRERENGPVHIGESRR